MTAPRREDSPSVDAEHPWIGLASFTESSRGYFHGRDDEIAELGRRIQRKPLTVLFGKSGLGKTSILQAGVVPRLRDQGYCPVYLRIDYAADAPSAARQIKLAIVKAAELSGRWSREGVADEAESLWAFLHHRDDVLLDADDHPLMPLLIFDQFEEIFTLAQADEQGRERAAAFQSDLADIVENRPPAQLEALLEDDDSAYERYDLARADYRVVISLREDYLAHLEGLKAGMPSITQNRLRLAPMTGTQALSAVVEPGRRLVNDDVAAAIVRFVAGGAEVAHAEVEPSLLSLICRELNDQRIARGRPGIGADLLAGSHTSILGEFYERSVADQPAGVRTFIEDHLLTDSGYRENVAEERVRSEFAAAGAQPGALALLVDRRLLRIEERLDLRRVELTHDVLCAIVCASRDARREREAVVASERLAADQAERARLAQRALRRARGVAAVCILLAVGAVGASVFAVVSSRRAEQAQRNAQATRVRAEQLLGYLQNDFANQLIPLGRLDLVRSLDDRVVAYFDGVPEDQRTAAWAHARALALLAQLETRFRQGQHLNATPSLHFALDILEARVAGGHRSESDLAELGRALADEAEWLGDGKDDRRQALQVDRRAAALLSEALRSAPGSPSTRMIQADISKALCYSQTGMMGGGQRDGAIASCELGRRQYAALGALDLRNPVASAAYLWNTWTLMNELDGQGRSEDALQISEQALKLSRDLVTRYPAYSNALNDLGLLESEMGHAYMSRLDLARASSFDADAEAIFLRLSIADPTVAPAWNNLSYTRSHLAQISMEQGDPATAIERLRVTLAADDAAPRAPYILKKSVAVATELALIDADRGDMVALARVVSRRNALQAELERPLAQADVMRQRCSGDRQLAGIALASNDIAAASRLATEALARIDVAPETSRTNGDFVCGAALSSMLGQAQYLSGEPVDSERSLRHALEEDAKYPDASASGRRWVARVSTWLALAQIHQGHLAEARSTLAPVLALHRGLAAISTQSALQRLEMAAALYAQALAEATPAQRLRLLNEAAALVDGLPAPMRALHSVKMWEGWIMSAHDAANDRLKAGFSDVLHEGELTSDAACRSPALVQERKA